MPSVVFTGKAVINGRPMDRADLARICTERGWSVRDKVDWGVDYLACSRTDTIKARAAANCRTEAITYDRLAFLLNGGNASAPASVTLVDVPEVPEVPYRYTSDATRALNRALPAAEVRARCPIHMCTLRGDGSCVDCARIEDRRGLPRGQFASRVNEARRLSAAQEAARDVANRPTCPDHWRFLEPDGACADCEADKPGHDKALADKRALNLDDPTPAPPRITGKRAVNWDT